MLPEFRNGNVVANCPDCGGAKTTFEFQSGGAVFGLVSIDTSHKYNETVYQNITYKLLRCSGCHRAGIAKVHMQKNYFQGELEWFFPESIERAELSDKIPSGIVIEYREAEDCASIRAYRAASGMLRSVLEKTLQDNGYKEGSLASRIDEAAADGVITESRKKRAHKDIRVLGNDVLHDKWRKVDYGEFEAAHRYTQRILEDFYDDRASVMRVLKDKGRIKNDVT